MNLPKKMAKKCPECEGTVVMQGVLNICRGNCVLLLKIGGKPAIPRVRAHCGNAFD